MKKLQFVSRLVLAASILLWTAGRVFRPMPDWGVRVSGAGVCHRAAQGKEFIKAAGEY